MSRSLLSGITWIATALAIAACGDNQRRGGDDVPPQTTPALEYTNPTSGALLLVSEPQTAGGSITLDLVVGNKPVTGYSVGFDLPLDTSRATLAAFHPGAALDPGKDPVAAAGKIPDDGPLRGMLVTGLSQKASGPGAVEGDRTLAPGAVLYRVEMSLKPAATPGVVFDGTAPGFALPSAGMRNKAGTTVVDTSSMAIGKLSVVLK